MPAYWSRKADSCAFAPRPGVSDRETTVSYTHLDVYKRQAKEFALLEYLMLNRGRVLSRETIENHIWNFDYEGGTNVVDVYISYLRKKIDGGAGEKLIHTVRGSGYVLRGGEDG